ncbi:hypothetical protein M0802_005225 [Mischocyttarus mexicanus]|nr:hypothetical protein M0802_005225 [Mischocyttarus mexicanus]
MNTKILKLMPEKLKHTKDYKTIFPTRKHRRRVLRSRLTPNKDLVLERTWLEGNEIVASALVVQRDTRQEQQEEERIEQREV